jgi:hypothetical protein
MCALPPTKERQDEDCTHSKARLIFNIIFAFCIFLTEREIELYLETLNTFVQRGKQQTWSPGPETKGALNQRRQELLERTRWLERLIENIKLIE